MTLLGGDDERPGMISARDITAGSITATSIGISSIRDANPVNVAVNPQRLTEMMRQFTDGLAPLREAYRNLGHALDGITQAEPVIDPAATITAAGGWCAPSSTVYELAGQMDYNEVAQMPAFPRGGVTFTVPNVSPEVVGILTGVSRVRDSETLL